ncbi:hypothetical protein M422DRAFT_781382 [Sphaerobolus stellatus SS14]|uniref:Uncharacterized protein n=1 Tax=Sphaerobolus stellatus (strain SS14) TaxID=990650 RepID=A0A0C9VL05_SPHS4|nr:hypothetical protein M422DRAFT_781382 [Sphaerobolus stellatus SS14]
MSPETVDESTPLLTSANDVDVSFPPIFQAIETIPVNPDAEDLHCYPRSLDRTQPLQAAIFRLILLFNLLNTKQTRLPRFWNTLDILPELQEVAAERQRLQDFAISILDELPATAKENEAVGHSATLEYYMTFPFRTEPASKRTVKALDFFAMPHVPASILCHKATSLSLNRLWKFGTIDKPLTRRSLSTLRLLQFYDSIATPRSVHAVHLAFRLAFISMLAHLLLYPSPLPILVNSPGGPLEIREPLIIIYSVSSLFGSLWSLAGLLHLLTLIAFAFSLPTSSPLVGSDSYTLLLFVLFFFLISLPFPSTPSYILLFDPPSWLPLCSLYISSFHHYILPVFVFFAPVFVGSAVLLSLSLSGEIPMVKFFTIVENSPESPYSSRLTFLILFSITCLLFLYFSIASHLLIPISNRTGRDDLFTWDRHGDRLGYDGRQILVQALLKYHIPHSGTDNLAFPPPLNVFGGLMTISNGKARLFYLLMWRLTVIPLAFILSGLWGWDNLGFFV